MFVKLSRIVFTTKGSKSSLVLSSPVVLSSSLHASCTFSRMLAAGRLLKMTARLPCFLLCCFILFVCLLQRRRCRVLFCFVEPWYVWPEMPSPLRSKFAHLFRFLFCFEKSLQEKPEPYFLVWGIGFSFLCSTDLIAMSITY